MNSEVKQKLINEIENNTYSLLSNLNKLIENYELELQEYYFKNVKEEKLNGNIDIPLIYNEDSDYEKIRSEISNLKSKIKFIDKKLNNEKYLMVQIEEDDDFKKLNFSEKKKIIEKRLNSEKNKLIKEKNKYQKKLGLIQENPKKYLRFLEFSKSDFSSVCDNEVKSKLESKRMELMLYRNFRENLLNSLNEKNEDCKKYIYNKKSNKRIDND